MICPRLGIPNSIQSDRTMHFAVAQLPGPPRRNNKQRVKSHFLVLDISGTLLRAQRPPGLSSVGGRPARRGKYALGHSAREAPVLLAKARLLARCAEWSVHCLLRCVPGCAAAWQSSSLINTCSEFRKPLADLSERRSSRGGTARSRNSQSPGLSSVGGGSLHDAAIMRGVRAVIRRAKRWLSR